MSYKSLINQLLLAYAPLTAYEFAEVKEDPDFEKAIERASLYIIAQRPIISFENVTPDEIGYKLNFEIHQKGNDQILTGNLPLIQSVVGSKETDAIGLAFNFLDRTSNQKEPPFENVHGFSLFKQLKNAREFLMWFSPEKILYNWWNGHIECAIKGDFRSFLKYKVHYVGKATRQSIIKRLTGHSTFQDILSLEGPLTKKEIPANEIAILCFEFQDNLQIQSFGSNDSISNMVLALKGEGYPLQEKIFLDAEKALINAIKPNYNKELFRSYPRSKDGLYNDKYNAFSYTFMDPITLIYEEGQINGGLSKMGGDSILILDNKEIKLVKQ